MCIIAYLIWVNPLYFFVFLAIKFGIYFEGFQLHQIFKEN